jgi:cytochrome c-type protein NapB
VNAGRHLRTLVVLGLAGGALACGGGAEPAVPRSTVERAAGRAYDGAPPVIPHDALPGTCTTCHDEDGAAIPGVGVAPASPHEVSSAAGAMGRCRQCHVAAATADRFVATTFAGLPQGPWAGRRATPGAPPTVPHPMQLRENCLACHAGPAARVELRTTHPERVRCRQCHVSEGAAPPFDAGSAANAR